MDKPFPEPVQTAKVCRAQGLELRRVRDRLAGKVRSPKRGQTAFFGFAGLGTTQGVRQVPSRGGRATGGLRPSEEKNLPPPSGIYQGERGHILGKITPRQAARRQVLLESPVRKREDADSPMDEKAGPITKVVAQENRVDRGVPAQLRQTREQSAFIHIRGLHRVRLRFVGLEGQVFQSFPDLFLVHPKELREARLQQDLFPTGFVTDAGHLPEVEEQLHSVFIELCATIRQASAPPGVKACDQRQEQRAPREIEETRIQKDRLLEEAGPPLRIFG